MSTYTGTSTCRRQTVNVTQDAKLVALTCPLGPRHFDVISGRTADLLAPYNNVGSKVISLQAEHVCATRTVTYFQKALRIVALELYFRRMYAIFSL